MAAYEQIETNNTLQARYYYYYYYYYYLLLLSFLLSLLHQRPPHYTPTVYVVVTYMHAPEKVKRSR